MSPRAALCGRFLGLLAFCLSTLVGVLPKNVKAWTLPRSEFSIRPSYRSSSHNYPVPSSWRTRSSRVDSSASTATTYDDDLMNQAEDDPPETTGMPANSATKTYDPWMEKRGDSRGAALLLEDVSVFRGPVEILKGIDWRVEPRTKWALVGQNGAGKSTLLKAVVGEIAHDGRVIIGTQERVGYLQQTAVAGSIRTVFEEAAAGMTELQKAREAMEKAQLEDNWEALERASARFEALGGYQQDQKVANVLKGLGFTNLDKRCDELSGGWQMRVAFARLLLSDPTLCLMDEPGNHLDAAAKKWLAKYLADYDGDGAMILVTHDVELLQSMDHIAEVVAGHGSLQIFKSCNYQEYLQLKEQRAAAAISEFEKNSEKAAKLQSFVDRFGASATKASAAQSRVKQLERMEREGLLDAPADAVVAQRFRPTLVLADPPRAVGEILLSLVDASVGHDDKILVSGINLDVTKGMKLLIRGPNGAGKSTCLHALAGSLPLIGGQRKENPSLRLGMFTQDLAQELDPLARAVDIVTEYARSGKGGDITTSEEKARGAMGRLGLQGEKALRRICDLSGGQKARVALAMFAMKPSNVYLLDEASNHLDIECVEALSDALCDWGKETGALVVVSHDRTFCDKIEFTHVATVRNGSFVVEQRGAQDSDWVISGLSATADVPAKGSAANGSLNGKEVDPKLRKQAFNAPKRIAKLEELVGEAEAKIRLIDEEMIQNGRDTGKLLDLTKKKEAIEAKVKGYMDEWEQLEELLASVA